MPFVLWRTMLRWCTCPPRRYITHSPLEGYEPPSQDRKPTSLNYWLVNRASFLLGGKWIALDNGTLRLCADLMSPRHLA